MPNARALLVASILLARSAVAQGVTVRGLAWDSLRGRPLAGAFVTLGTDGRSATADERGRFHFDAVAPGAYVVSVQHAALDSIGVSGIATRVRVPVERDSVVVASPSFSTLWARSCGVHPMPLDSALVFGTVTDARTGLPVPRATVEATWPRILATRPDGRRKSADAQADTIEHRIRGTTHADARGHYGLCGLPPDVGLRIRARADAAASGEVDVFPDPLRARRRDLRIAPVGEDAVTRGTVLAVVSAAEGPALANAVVVADGIDELRTDARGHALLRRVPLGTRQVAVYAIGRAPVYTVVDVTPGDTASFVAQMRSLTMLDLVRVSASARVRRLLAELEDRRQSGLGVIRDSSAINGYVTLLGVFTQFPGAQAVATGRLSGDFYVTLNGCTASIWLDGKRTGYDEIGVYTPDDFAYIEVYPLKMHVPQKYQASSADCGVIALWTKREMK